MATSCALLAGNRINVSAVLPGLLWSEGRIRPDEHFFKCCDGTGSSLDFKTNVVKRCDFKRRILIIQKLAKLLAERWGPEFVSSLVKESLTVEELQWLSNYGQTPSLKGFFKTSSKENQGPSRLWLVAFAAAWRFGYLPHMVTLQKTKAHDLLPNTELAQNLPTIVLVENIDELWKAENLYDFETLIGWCNNAVMPLCCEYKYVKSTGPRPTGRTRISDRIQEKKSKHPIEWLEADSRMKIQFVSQISMI